MRAALDSGAPAREQRPTGAVGRANDRRPLVVFVEIGTASWLFFIEIVRHHIASKTRVSDASIVTSRRLKAGYVLFRRALTAGRERPASRAPEFGHDLGFELVRVLA